MTRAAIALVATAFLGTGLAMVPATAAAQQKEIAEIIVYGNDPCPRSTDDQVVVCARKPEAERYRIPEKLRPSGPRQSRDAWANRATEFLTVGQTGTYSCSPVGPGGYTGCLTQVINKAKREREEEATEGTPPEQ
jgi:hypothetical protein